MSRTVGYYRDWKKAPSAPVVILGTVNFKDFRTLTGPEVFFDVQFCRDSVELSAGEMVNLRKAIDSALADQDRLIEHETSEYRKVYARSAARKPPAPCPFRRTGFHHRNLSYLLAPPANAP